MFESFCWKYLKHASTVLHRLKTFAEFSCQSEDRFKNSVFELAASIFA
jgi:hypothetical protein